MSPRLPGNRILYMEMPSWLRNSPLENSARSFAKWIKLAIQWLERKLRGGKIKMKLSSIRSEVWLDYNFAVRVPMPEEDELLAAFVGALNTGDVVYDVGGFIGWYAIAAAKCVGPSGMVFAFEPAPSSAELLRIHLKINSVESQVRVIQAACSESFDLVSMPVWPIGLASGNSLRKVVSRSDISPEHVVVYVLPLDKFYETSKMSPDVIKIDVEGAELQVLKGAKEILSKLRPIIFLELHTFAWHHFGTTEEELRELLDGLSYDILDVSFPHQKMSIIPERGFAILKPSELQLSSRFHKPYTDN